jgi:hypothetical protein
VVHLRAHLAGESRQNAVWHVGEPDELVAVLVGVIGVVVVAVEVVECSKPRVSKYRLPCAAAGFGMIKEERPSETVWLLVMPATAER